MIKANELRIGNYVLFGESFPELIRLESFAILNKYPERINWIKPIPLTTEILEKAGFSKNGDWAQIDFNPRMGIRFFNWNSAECDIIQDDKFIAFKCGHIKYLHQLQNLYFALTGEELTIEDLNVERSVATGDHSSNGDD